MAYSASEIATCATATANTAVSVSIEVSVSSGLETSRDNLSGLLTFYPGYCEVPVLHVEFPSSNFACEGAVDVHKILMVCFQMEFNMFEHVFQDLKAVDDAEALFSLTLHRSWAPTSALLMNIITCTILSTVWNK